MLVTGTNRWSVLVACVVADRRTIVKRATSPLVCTLMPPPACVVSGALVMAGRVAGEPSAAYR